MVVEPLSVMALPRVVPCASCRLAPAVLPALPRTSVPVPLTEPEPARRMSAPVPLLVMSALMTMLLAALSVRLLAVLLVTASATVMLPVWLPALPGFPVVTVTLVLLSAVCKAATLTMAELALDV